MTMAAHRDERINPFRSAKAATTAALASSEVAIGFGSRYKLRWPECDVCAIALASQMTALRPRHLHFGKCRSGADASIVVSPLGRRHHARAIVECSCGAQPVR